MNKENKTPLIRFKGFSDDWEQRKLGEVVNVCSGRDYKHLVEGNIPVYGTGGYMLSVSEALSENEDAIGIGRKGTIDSPYVLKAPFWTVDTLFYCIPNKNNDLNFVYGLYQKINWKSMDESTGVPSLSKTAINNVDVSTTSLSEQAKIGSYFQSLDNLITLHQRKCESLKKVKKSMLQKMFPKNGESVPEIRFAGFTDDWEQRKLGEVSSSYSGGTPTAGKSEYYDGNIPFIRSGEINEDKTELYISELGFNSSSAAMVEKGDILYALYGATSGEVSISQIKGAINQAILAIKPNDNYDSRFIMQWLRKQKQSIISTYLQGGQGNLSGNIVKSLKIDVTSLSEQQKIGSYFQSLDNLITLHQRKVEKLKNIKKSMLQKMFV